MPTALEFTPAIITQVADAVVDALNNGEFTEDQAEAREVTRFETAEEAIDTITQGKLRIAVLCEGVRRTQLSRKSKQLECDISVAIVRKLTTSEDALLAGDRMQRLAEDLAVWLEETELQCGLNVRHQETTIRLLYSPYHLKENTTHLLPITFTYRVYT